MSDCVVAGIDAMSRPLLPLVEIMLNEQWSDDWDAPRYSPDVYEGRTSPKDIPGIGGLGLGRQ